MHTTTTTATLTRADYMEGRCTHREYYAAIARDAGIGGFSDAFIERVRAALAAGDEHLNTITLATWDRMAGMPPMEYRSSAAGFRPSPHLVSALKRAGDTCSLSQAVCAYKEAARVAASKA